MPDTLVERTHKAIDAEDARRQIEALGCRAHGTITVVIVAGRIDRVDVLGQIKMAPASSPET